MKGSARVEPEEVPCPSPRPAAFAEFQGEVPGSSSASTGGVLGLAPSLKGQGQGQYCGHMHIFPSSLTVPAGTP